MLIHVNTDNHIHGSEELVGWVEQTLTQSFDRFQPQLMRIEVQLADENSLKGNIDKRCLLEARLSGLEPIVASEKATTVDQALEGAIDSLTAAIERRLQRLSDKDGRVSMNGDVE
jgi:ribosome-associated translation inhibitor RaiA